MSVYHKPQLQGFLGETWDRVVASDPGLTRLRVAASSAVAVASTLLVEYGFAKLIHAGGKAVIVSMLLGAVMGMMGTMALSGTGSVWSKARVAMFFPIAVGGGLVAGAAVSRHTDLMLSIFVVVMFVAVAIRRFGIPYFFYGFMGWMGYFFASFMQAKLSAIPALLVSIVIATVWILLLSMTVLRTNAHRTLQRTLSAFRARARAVTRVCADLLRATDDRQRKKLKRRLHSRQVQLAETALMVEGWSAEPGAVPPGRHAPVLRRRIIDVQHVLDQLAGSTVYLAEGSPTLALAAAEVAEHLAHRDDDSAAIAARNLATTAVGICAGAADTGSSAATASTSEGWQQFAVEQFARAALELSEISISSILEDSIRTDADDSMDEFEPAVGLFMGDLPGSPAVAGDVPARGVHWNPLARLDLPTRQAIQVAVAGGLAILAGRELSPLRYYWAVIAAFVMFTGTATRTETYLKGVSRVLGTLLGLVVSIWAAQLTAGHTSWVVAVVVLCIFFGFYLIRVNYAYMIFFITIMLGQLYSVLHEFSPGLLLLRLEETVIGATIGFLVAVVVVPLSTRDTVRTVRKNLFLDLETLLGAAADQMQGDGHSGIDLDAHARALDNRLRQLALVAKPLAWPLIWGRNAHARHRVVLYAALVTVARALAVGLRDACPRDATQLSKACRDLASVAKRLAEASLKSQMPDAVLEIRIPVQLDDPVADPITRRLLHLQRLLYDIEVDPVDPI